jgi:hypothetical protein
MRGAGGRRWEWRNAGRNGDRVADPGFARSCQRQLTQSGSKHGGITSALRGCADRQHGRKRERHDREKRANPSEWDTSTSAVTRHHRYSSSRVGKAVSGRYCRAKRALGHPRQSAAPQGPHQDLTLSPVRVPVVRTVAWPIASTRPRRRGARAVKRSRRLHGVVLLASA